MNTELTAIRNVLRQGKCNNDIKRRLIEIRGDVSLFHNPFHKIINEAVKNALEEIDLGNYQSASYQIGFIHNMPFNIEDIENWDSEHFYEFELPVFFEHTDGTHRIKKMVKLIAELIED